MNSLIFSFDIIVLLSIIFIYTILIVIDLLLYKIRCKKEAKVSFKSIYIKDIKQIYLETDKKNLYFSKEFSILDISLYNKFKSHSKFFINGKVYTINKVVKRFEFDFLEREVFYYNIFFNEFLNIELPFTLDLNDITYKKIVISDNNVFIFSKNGKKTINSLEINRKSLLLNNKILIDLKGVSQNNFISFNFLLNKYFHKFFSF